MAYSPKGYSREEFNNLRQARYEQTGEWQLATSRDLVSGQGFITDENGNRLYDETGRAIRGIGVYNQDTGRFNPNPYRSIFNPERFQGDLVYDDSVWSGDTSGGMVLGEEEIEALGINTLPAQLSEIPTSSSNASRPRTLAAGWHREIGSNRQPREERLGRLTVMFRDGTLYNYYDVSYAEWRTFKGSLSKGPMLNRASKTQGYDGFLLNHPHGPANISDVPIEIQRGIQSMAREAQLKYATTNRARAGYKPVDRRRKGAQTPEPVKYVPRSASKKSGLNPNRKRATNPATANQQKKR